MSEGFYLAINDTVELLAGPDSSRGMVEALKAITERLKAGTISKDQALEDATNISERHADILRTFLPLGIAGLTVLLTIIQIYLAIQGASSSSVDAQKLLDAVNQQTIVVKEIANQQRVLGHEKSPSADKTKTEKLAIKDKAHRRTQVHKQRRESLKIRRLAFGCARTH
jgi:hypothetical protein